MSDPERSWDRVGQQFSALGQTLKEHFRRVEASGDETTKQEVKDAMQSLINAADRLASATRTAARDPRVQQDAKAAADSLFDVLGATFDDLAAEFRKRRRTRSPGSDG